MRANHHKNKNEDLTIEEAKAFECCKGLSDKEILELLKTVKTFCEVAFSIHSKKDGMHPEFQQAA
jgi:hypothetical protein